MRPSRKGRPHSLYRAATAMYRIATALYRAATAFCRYAGSTTGFVHILGPHLSGFVGAPLPLHSGSIAAPAPSQATCADTALLPPSSSKSIFTGANYGFLPPSSSIGVVPNSGKSSLISIPLTPFSRGHIRAYGLSIAARLPCPPTPARHLKMPSLRNSACEAPAERAMPLFGLLIIVMFARYTS